MEVNGVRFEAFISQRNLPAPPKQSVSANLFLAGIMNWLDNNKLAFQMHNIFGFTYIFEPPSFSKYKLRFSYKNYKSTLYAAQSNTIEIKPVAGFWTGKVTTHYVDFDIVQHD